MTEAKTLLSRMMMKLPTITGACCIAALLPFSTHAATNDLDEGMLSLAPSRVLLNADGSRDHWNGIGRIKSRGGSSCTATLIDTRTPDSPPDAPAYVVTSGHCISRQNGVIITDREVEGSIQFNFFTDSTARSYPLKRINWSSMQGVDLAVVELQPTLKSLIDDGIQPLALASEMPEQDREILWVGAPLTRNTGHLRMAACVHKTSEVIMEQPWVWRHTVRNQCRGVDTGASGSPLLTRDNNEVYAALNLTNQASSANATEDFSDEIPGFPPMVADSNYGNPVTLLNKCFVSGTLSTDPAICDLFPTFLVDFETLAPEPQVKIDKNRFGASSVSWSYEHRLIDHYTVKMGPPDTTDCSDPQGFKTQFRDLTLRATSLPLKICTYAHDINGQPSALREDIVPAAD
ncbi:trypsin [Pseudomonas syringae pv. actinidifoliorum]|nr:trypsin [Pseudomonas syringae pv. actinidifoliorum]NAT57390.1 trypsin [Pseudomonas syringae pv. actinidifoliorum]